MPLGQVVVIDARHQNGPDQRLNGLVPASRTIPPLKIYVEQDGLYQVTYQDLKNAGFLVDTLDPRLLSLTNKGHPSAITIEGEADGRFDPHDTLIFYGLALTSTFTTRNVYWLGVGEDAPLRMAQRDVAPTNDTLTAPSAFINRLHLAENHHYWAMTPGDNTVDHWFWVRFPPAPARHDFTFKLQNIADLARSGAVQVRLQGRSSTNANPDHHTQLFLNQTLIDDAQWDGDREFVQTVSVPQTLFRNGENVLSIVAPGDTEAAIDTFYVNDFEIRYWDRFVAENDHLEFSALITDETQVKIQGFTQRDIALFDITQPRTPVQLVRVGVEMMGSDYHLHFEDAVRDSRRYLALASAQKQTPANLQVDMPSNWKHPTNQADYIIITHEDFVEAITPLAQYRSDQGHQVSVVKVQDVYDEFSDGIFTPQAIQDFLRYAYQHWASPAPQYVLLVGDANYDYLNHLGTDQENFVPTQWFKSDLIGQTFTDHYFVTLNDDDPRSVMAIGRLPVQTAAETDVMVEKIIAYEQQPVGPDWHRRVLFVADDDLNFADVSDDQGHKLPSYYQVETVYAQDFIQPYDPTNHIIDRINQGVSIINYAGHGNVSTWGNWGNQTVLQGADLLGLTNMDRYPFLVTGNCSNGLFAHPSQESLAEVFVQYENGGGVAAWSPTGLGFSVWHNTSVSALYDHIFTDQMTTLGPAIMMAKHTTFNLLSAPEPLALFTLFGDPALSLYIFPPSLELTIIGPTHSLPGQVVTYTLKYANLSEQTIDDAVLTYTTDVDFRILSAHPPPLKGSGVWHLKALSAGATGSVTLTGQLSADTLSGTTMMHEAVLRGGGLNSVPLQMSTFIGEVIYLPLIETPSAR
ncbi:MAG: C25 family cysteine peptidase [Chloroflexota bacterium]